MPSFTVTDCSITSRRQSLRPDLDMETQLTNADYRARRNLFESNTAQYRETVSSGETHRIFVTMLAGETIRYLLKDSKDVSLERLKLKRVNDAIARAIGVMDDVARQGEGDDGYGEALSLMASMHFFSSSRTALRPSPLSL